MGFDLRILETFIVVGRELNYRRAAELLFVSQPAVSQQIKKLEQQLGFALFERSSTSVRLTADGAALHAAAERALNELREVLRPIELIRQPQQRRVRLGYITTWARTEIPKLAALIDSEALDVRVVLQSYMFDDLLQALRSDELDLAIFHLPDVLELDTSELAITRVGSTRRFVALPKTHPLAQRDSVRLTELELEHWVGATGIYGENFVARCAQSGFVPNIKVTAANAETMLGLVRAGLGVTVVPNQPPGWDDLQFTPIDDDVLDIVVAQRRQAQAVVRPLIDLIRTTFAPSEITPDFVA
ncbi:hypothetical protein BAY59_27230 [Prauserella coralliicola]|nr:hypothetical protein BAY59_27230 [Prauserella coralliicola]